MSNNDTLKVDYAFRAYKQFVKTQEDSCIKEMRKQIGELSEAFQAEHSFYDWVDFYTKTGVPAVAMDVIDRAGQALMRVRTAR